MLRRCRVFRFRLAFLAVATTSALLTPLAHAQDVARSGDQTAAFVLTDEQATCRIGERRFYTMVLGRRRDEACYRMDDRGVHVRFESGLSLDFKLTDFDIVGV